MVNFIFMYYKQSFWLIWRGLLFECSFYTFYLTVTSFCCMHDITFKWLPMEWQSSRFSCVLHTQQETRARGWWRWPACHTAEPHSEGLCWVGHGSRGEEGPELAGQAAPSRVQGQRPAGIARESSLPDGTHSTTPPQGEAWRDACFCLHDLVH